MIDVSQDRPSSCRDARGLFAPLIAPCQDRFRSNHSLRSWAADAARPRLTAPGKGIPLASPADFRAKPPSIGRPLAVLARKMTAFSGRSNTRELIVCSVSVQDRTHQSILERSLDMNSNRDRQLDSRSRTRREQPIFASLSQATIDSSSVSDSCSSGRCKTALEGFGSASPRRRFYNSRGSYFPISIHPLL